MVTFIRGHASCCVLGQELTGVVASFWHGLSQAVAAAQWLNCTLSNVAAGWSLPKLWRNTATVLQWLLKQVPVRVIAVLSLLHLWISCCFSCTQPVLPRYGQNACMPVPNTVALVTIYALAEVAKDWHTRSTVHGKQAARLPASANSLLNQPAVQGKHFAGGRPVLGKASSSLAVSAEPSIADVAAATAITPVALRSAPANPAMCAAASTKQPVIEAGASNQITTPSVPCFTADGGKRRKRHVAYIRSAGAVSENARVKIHGFHLDDLTAGATQRFIQQLASSGQMVVNMVAREGCIELVIDFIDLSADARQPRGNSFGTDGCIGVEAELRGGGAHGGFPGRSLSAAEVVSALAALQLPFAEQEVAVQVGHEIHPTRFQRDITRQQWTVMAPEALDTDHVEQPLWLVTPVAVCVSADINMLELHVATAEEFAPIPVAALSARASGHFLDVADLGGASGGFTVQVPALGELDSVVHLDVQLPGEVRRLSTMSSGVLLLHDAAVAAELNEQLQPLMVVALMKGDTEQLQNWQDFIADLGNWVQFVTAYTRFANPAAGPGSSPHSLPVPFSPLANSTPQQVQQLLSAMLDTAVALQGCATEQGFALTAAVVASGMASVAAVTQRRSGDLIPALSVAVACVKEACSVLHADIETPPLKPLFSSAGALTQAPGPAGLALPVVCSTVDGSTSSPVSARGCGHSHCFSQDSSAAVVAATRYAYTTLPWSVMLRGFPEHALEARYMSSLHHARTSHLSLLAIFAVLLAFAEVTRVVAEQSVFAGIPHTVWGLISFAMWGMHQWRPSMYEAHPHVWPLVYWFAQSFVLAWYVAGLPVRAGIAALTLSKHSFVNNIVHQCLMALFKQVRLPAALLMYTGTSLLVAGMKVRFGADYTVLQLVKQQLPFWLLATSYTAVQDYRGRLAVLRQVHAQAMAVKKRA